MRTPVAPRRLRRLVRRTPILRSVAFLARDLVDLAFDTRRRSRAQQLEPYATVDPWHYERSWGTEHIRCANGLLERALLPDGAQGADLGCGEGYLTPLVASRCAEVLAVDISDVALARARERCSHLSHVNFRNWDLLEGPDLGRFDLVVFAGLLETLRRPARMRRARTRVLSMLQPGGYLLSTVTRQAAEVEGAPWGRFLVRGTRSVDAFLVRSGQLERVDVAESATHVLTLYRVLP